MSRELANLIRVPVIQLENSLNELKKIALISKHNCFNFEVARATDKALESVTNYTPPPQTKFGRDI